MSAFPLRAIRQNYAGTVTWRDPTGWVSNFILRPVLMITTFGVLHEHLEGETSHHLVLGLALYGIVVTLAMGFGHSLLNDLQFGTLTVAFTTPTSATAVWAGRMAGHVPNAVVSAVVGFTFARVAFGADVLDGGAVNAAAAVSVMASGIGLALLVNVLTLTGGHWAGPLALGTGLVLTCSGAVIPRAVLPGPIQAVSAVLPMSHANDVLQRTGGSPWANVAAELLVAAGFGLAGLGAFHWWLRRARHRGLLTLEAA